jgi:hypothetical protein
LIKTGDQVEIFQISTKMLPEKESEDQFRENVEFNSVTVGRGGGVRVETMLDMLDGSEGPKSFRRTILTAYVALGTTAAV